MFHLFRQIVFDGHQDTSCATSTTTTSTDCPSMMMTHFTKENVISTTFKEDKINLETFNNNWIELIWVGKSN